MECQSVYGRLVRPVEGLINRTQIFLHSISLLLLLFYRLSFFFFYNINTQSRAAPTFTWLLVFASELLLCFIWLLGRPSRWHFRRLYSDQIALEQNDGLPPLPGIDVFICTADPEKEPTLEVMNTLISAMALDYPPEKLHVYFSDDGGSPATLHAIRQARRFAGWWIPFCRKYGITQPCPEAYFSAAGEDRRHIPTDEFLEQHLIMEKYKEFKNEISSGTKRWASETATTSRLHHPALVQIIKSNDSDGAEESRNEIKMPVVVYVSREKNPSHPHHFKAGALNVLMRVSGAMSNSAYILVLDCDMYCNDPTSARRAMWFHLHHPISHSLSFVQFPQKFHNVTKNDIYDSQLRSIFMVEWSGMNRLRGPILSGTCFYIKRLSLYATSPRDNEPLKHREDLGASNEFMKSLDGIKGKEEEVQVLASCTYENGSEWGQKIGFFYDSVVEDFLTSLVLHSKGWRSVYCNPEKAQFLGSGTTRLNEVLVQGTRWSSGLLEVAISRFCPLFYGFTSGMCALQTMCYAELAFYPLCSFSIWCFAAIPQLCLLNGVPIFPKVSSPFFLVYCFIFISSLSIHLHEVLISGGSVQKWINEQRIWMIKGITCHFYGSLDALMKKIGLRNARFVPTNKVVDDDQIKRYNMDMFDFQASTLFLAPIAGLVFLNLVSFTIGVGRVVAGLGDWDEMFGQLFLSFYILLMSFPIIDAMLIRSDEGRFPLKVTLGSVFVVLIFLYLDQLNLIM